VNLQHPRDTADPEGGALSRFGPRLSDAEVHQVLPCQGPCKRGGDCKAENTVKATLDKDSRRLPSVAQAEPDRIDGAIDCVRMCCSGDIL